MKDTCEKEVKALPEPSASTPPNKLADNTQSPYVENELVIEKTNSLQKETTSARKCERPVRIFFLLALLHCITYMDRGSVATNAVNGHRARDGEDGEGFQGDLEMSNFQNGVLSSLFMLGRILGCPIVARVSLRVPPFVVIGVGTLLWAIAVICCGLSFHFYSMAVCRFMAGLGQSPVVILGPVVLDDIAPESSIMTWFSLLELTAPVGVAIGFFYGPLVVSFLTWRYAFYIQGLVVLPFVIFCFISKKFDLRRDSDAQESENLSTVYTYHCHRTDDASGEVNSSRKNMRDLLSHILYDLAVVGTSLHMGFLICMEYWGSRALEAIFNETGIDMTFGALLVVSGICGTLIGGRLMDSVFGATVSSSFYISGFPLLVGPLFFVPVTLLMQSYIGLLAFYFAVMVLIFIPLGPSNAATLWTVPLTLRPLSRGLSIVAQQVVGTIPAPAVYGAILDFLEKNDSEANSHRLTTSIVSSFLVVAASLFLFGAITSPKHPDYKMQGLPK